MREVGSLQEHSALNCDCRCNQPTFLMVSPVEPRTIDYASLVLSSLIDNVL
ncbi:hypothetical protein ABIC60_000322 [Phyllobacterium ifriqiyense]